MKKLIAISVVFALVAGAAFAADVSVDVFGGVSLIKGDTGKDGIDAKLVDKDGKPGATDSHKPAVSGQLNRVRIEGSGENDEGSFGAWARFETGAWWGAGSNTVSGVGTVWWKPLDPVKLTIGRNPDGLFGADGITRWGFYQNANEVGVTKEAWNFDPSFYGGWGDGGAILTLTPVEPLAINLAIPYFAGGEPKDAYMKSTLQVAYDIEGIGKFAITYKSGVGNKAAEDPTVYKVAGNTWKFDDSNGTFIADPDAPTPGDIVGANGKDPVHDPGQLWLYFNLSAIENLGIDIGLGYTMPKSGKVIKDIETPWGKKTITEGSYNEPIAVGVGAKYDAGDFGVKTRIQVQLAGKYVEKDLKAEAIPLRLVFDVLPYYAVSESLSVLFSVGFDYLGACANNDDLRIKDDYAKTGFHVEPYITIKSSWWSPNFFAGIRIETDGVKYKDGAKNKDGSSVIEWSVPLGIAFSF